MKPRKVVKPSNTHLICAGPPRPSSPASIFAEDFSLLVRPRRMRIARTHIRVLS